MKLNEIIQCIKNKEMIDYVSGDSNRSISVNTIIDENGDNSYELIIRINDLCNIRCGYCFIRPKQGKRISDVVMMSINELCKHDLKNIRISISGGEPTINPEFRKIIEKLYSAGAEITIQTNAIRFSDRDFSESMKEFSKVKYFISFPSPVKEEYEKITNSEQYHNAVSGIRDISRTNSVQINMVINKENYHSIKDMLKFCKKEFNSENIKVTISDIGCLGSFDYSEYLVKYSEIIQEIIDATDLAKESHIDFSINLTGGCGFPICVMNDVELDNKMQFKIPCNKEMVRYDSYDGDFFKSNECKRCIYDDCCQGFHTEYVKTYGKDEIKPYIRLDRSGQTE